MNDQGPNQPAAMQSLIMLDELAEGAPISQREMAGRLGIAVGLVNSYLKTLVRKGFLQVKAYPRNRYAYLLTPSGFAEKSRLAYQQVAYFHTLFRTARHDSALLFNRLSEEGISEVAFCGVDEFTEIAYLSLCDVGLGLAAVYDERLRGVVFFGKKVQGVRGNSTLNAAPVVITSLRYAEDCRRELLLAGVEIQRIYGPIFGGHGADGSIEVA